MATLDDAAEALVIKVQGLDSEIEESQHRLADLRGQLEATAQEVEQEWKALTQAVGAFLEKVHEDQQRLDQETQHALQATADARQAAATGGAEANSDIAGAVAHLDAIAQHANALHTNVESLATDAGETPAHSLAQRAAQIEQELAHALEEARDFVRNDVVHGMEEVAHEIRDRCQLLRNALAESQAHALQASFDQWESKVGELEDYVKTKGFLASHDHARAYVDYALGECGTLCEEQLDSLRELLALLQTQIREFAHDAQSLSTSLAEAGTELRSQVEGTGEGAAKAVSALDSMKDLLAGLKFVQI